ncbi:patatin-like phospholipase family protein [Pedobacter cryoconitis]|uniref:PNPLA domain-containing protein n=1 Tax=Pedobacter cryoconitis TaxID=188932 RepID=A0A7X0J1K9_9SPHI|nr:patatin-like phospholipase family protein [Pedobacter cryoconitis]MBB6499148.1 hypothetical protein [Pedobacter cryoconitis]
MMTPILPTPQPFEIGLTLTGTVSAGAYTAGVIDFLLEALENWEQKKTDNRNKYQDDYQKWDVPWHEVVITGLSGASGGGVNCGLILNTIGKQIDPVSEPPAGETKNDFYNIWVEMLGINELTKVDDLTGSVQLKSLLFGEAIPNIARKTFVKENFGNELYKKYISDNLKAILTVTNLRGIPYLLKTQGIGANELIYYRNADYVKFELARNNKPFYKDTNVIPYNTTDPLFQQSYNQLQAACLATCAFPAAFKTQPITQNETIYAQRENAQALAIPKGQDYAFLNGDGGICNTNPFELLHQDMLPPGVAHNPREGSNVNRCIIIVAPLDTDMVTKDTYDLKNDSIISALTSTFDAIRNEAEFTDEQIRLAIEDNVYSRFIIAPVRYDETGTQTVVPAITGTSLGNFGAFLSRDFREHDYFLGRRNAQQFLRRNFAIPLSEIVNNPIFKSLDIEHNKEKFKDFIISEQVTDKITNQTQVIESFCIIPLFGSTVAALYNPVWPKGKYNEDEIKADVNQRVGKVIDVALTEFKVNWFMTTIVKWFFKSKVIKAIMDKINSALQAGKLS